MAEETPSPVVVVCPYLWLDRPVELGDWWVGPLRGYSGPWASPSLEESAKRFLAGFVDVDGRALPDPALLASKTNGVTGLPPTPVERAALELAIGFGVIDQNIIWTPTHREQGWLIATADNADLWVQPLSGNGEVALGRGSRNRTTAGGYNINDPAYRVPPSLELHALTVPISIDQEVVAAVYQVLALPTTPQQAHVRELRVAIRWLIKSWLNSASISWEDRVVFLKSAFEGIAQTDRNAEAVPILRRRYESAVEQAPAGVGIDDLLWSWEEPIVVRTYRPPGGGAERTEDVTLFEDWYWSLAEARNSILHTGTTDDLMYQRDNSPYSGPLVETADRVIRELIKITLGSCGYPLAWRSQLTRTSIAIARALESDRLDNDD